MKTINNPMYFKIFFMGRLYALICSFGECCLRASCIVLWYRNNSRLILNITTNPSEVIVSAELNRLSTINGLMRAKNLLDVVLALGDKKVFYIDRSLPIALKSLKNDKAHKDRC